jgi:hypothetical protein
MAEEQATDATRQGVRLTRWRQQDGFVREAVQIAAVIVILAVLVLDCVSVVQTSLAVRQNATDAANQALATYVQTESTDMAMQSASTFLKLHDAVLLRSESTLSKTYDPSNSWVTITAAKTPHTYVFHYFQALPWGIGHWFHKILHPQATETNTS